MGNPYLGPLVRLVVPMQGHAAGVVAGTGTLSNASLPFPNQFIWRGVAKRSDEMAETGVSDRFFYPPDYDPVLSYRYFGITVKAIGINNSNLIVSRAQTDVFVSVDGHAPYVFFDEAAGGIVQYSPSAHSGVGPAKIDWVKKISFPGSLDNTTIPGVWSTDGTDDWSDGLTTLGSGSTPISDSVTATNIYGQSAGYHLDKMVFSPDGSPFPLELTYKKD
jgi:hypothetical protein